MAKGALQGIRILEFAGFGPAPIAAMMLADMGAEVIRIDRMARGSYEDEDVRRDVTRRSRRCVMLDLRFPEGVDLALRLVESADGLIEPYRPGVTERLGVGPDVCLKRNSRLVYGRATGWGQEGPLAGRAGHDLNYIAISGALHAIGHQDRPPPPPLNVLGDGAGGMLLAFGMVCGFLEVKRSGQGQIVDAAMLDAASLLFSSFLAPSVAGLWGARESNMVDGGAPFYNVYETADGKFISVAAIEPQFYAELIKRIGWDVADLPAQMDPRSWPAMKERFAKLFASRTREEWCALLDSGDTCFAPVLAASEVLQHPQMMARNAFLTIGGIPHPQPAPRFSVSGGSPPQEPRPRGADTNSVLGDLGLSETEISTLRERGVLG